jgi:hypothetical protein
MHKILVLSSLLFYTLLNSNLISNAERLRDENRAFNSRENLKTTFSAGLGIPGAGHIKYLNMTDNNWSFGLSLGTMLIGVNGSLDARYYFNDLNYYNSLYTETNIGLVYSSMFGFSTVTFVPTQKIGFEVRNDDGLTFNLAGGISYWTGTSGNGVIPAFDILVGYSY